MTTYFKYTALSLFSLGLLAYPGNWLHAQNVGINTTGAAGHPSAMLDVSANNKGVLLPNVALTGIADASTITSPAKGLMVWNTGISWGTSGYYYNDGTSGAPNWVKVATGTTAISNTLGNPVNTITSTVNGISASTAAVNTVSNTSSVNSISTTVNGVAGVGVNIINSHTLSWTKAGNMSSSVNGQAGSVAIGSGTVADVLGYNAAGTPVYESLTSVLKEPWYLENSGTPATDNTQNIYQNAKVGIGNFSAGQTFNTGSPVATLEITGTTPSLRVGPRYDAGGDRDYIDITSGGTASNITTSNEDFIVENIAAGTLTFKTNGSTRIQVASGGGVTMSSLGNGIVKSASGLLSNAVAGTDYQAPMSQGTGIGISGVTISNTGVLSLAGTANQINVSASTGAITLSTPQNIHTGASPTFAGATLTGLSPAGIVTNTAGGLLGTSTLTSLMADLTPGAGLTGTTIYDGSSAQTFSVASGNGLSTDATQDRVKLGGTLDENTSISKAGFNLVYNQTGVGDFDVQDNGSTSLFVYGNHGASTDGYVGIGTNTPTSKLQVAGSVFIPDGQSYWIGNNADAGERLRMHHSGITSYIDYNSGDLNFRPNAVNKVVFQSSGNVQILNLAGSGNRPVYADASGVLNTSVPVYKLASSLHPSNDDITWGTTIRSACADDAVGTINWGFNFMINGTAYTGGWISTNGVMGFGSNSTTNFGNTNLPTSISTDPMLFFHWDDDGSNLQRYVVLGTAPNRICYIHSRQSEATTCTNGASQVDVYITLHEGSNLISVRYIGIGSTAAVQGDGATYGFQFAGGASAYAVPLGYNTKLLDDNNGNQSFSIDLGQ